MASTPGDAHSATPNVEDDPAVSHDESDDDAERRVLYAALDSFRQYAASAHRILTHRRRQNFFALPTAHWQDLLGPAPVEFLSSLELIDDAIDVNARIARAILETSLAAFVPAEPYPEEEDAAAARARKRGRSVEDDEESDGEKMWWHVTATANDTEKAISTIKQFYRDWSAEGAVERNATYALVVEQLEREFVRSSSATTTTADVKLPGRNITRRSDVKILVPGAGLGRLVFDLCLAGYSVEGNEISYHQLMASNWILNYTQPGAGGQFDLYPFLGDFSNLVSRRDQLMHVKVPDVHPATALAAARSDAGDGRHGSEQKPGIGQMSMTASDFLLLYGKEEYAGTFDAVVTVFFVDTAPNLVRYIETIRNVLAVGGVWINKGPLQWHFGDRGPPTEHDSTTVEGAAAAADARQASTTTTNRTRRDEGQSGIEAPGSVELTLEETLLLIKRMGFSIVEQHVPSSLSSLSSTTAAQTPTEQKGYILNPYSMLQRTYRSASWVARKQQH